MDMKINKSAIAILLAATLCFTSVAPALAAETSGEDSVVTAVSEELNNEDFTEGESQKERLRFKRSGVPISRTHHF